MSSSTSCLLLTILLTQSRSGQSSVMISGGSHCTPIGQTGTVAEPNSTLVINCTVTNPLNLANLLHWNIPSYNVSVSHVDANPMNTDISNIHPEFVSIVLSSSNSPVNNNYSSTIASLQFPAISALDGAAVTCNDVQGNTDNCTLYIKTVPSAPISPMSPIQTYQSILLQWTPPLDNGGDTVNYIITVFPHPSSGNCIGGTCQTSNTSYNVTGLMFGVTYTISITANNTVGMSINSNVPVEVTVPGEVPPAVNDVSFCFNYTGNGITTLYITWTSCPVIIPNPAITPPITGYTVFITGPQDITNNNNVGVSCNGYSLVVADGNYVVEVSVDNDVGQSVKTSTSPFIVAWLHNIILSHIDINGAGTIEYTTVSTTLTCNSPQNLQIQLLRSDGVTSVKSYVPQTTDKFQLQFVNPSRPLMYTLQVIDASSTVVGSPHTGYIISPSSHSIQTSSTAATTSTNTPSPSTAGISQVIIIGAASGGGATILITLTIIFVCCCCCCQRRIDHMTDTIAPSESRAAVYEVTATAEDRVRKNKHDIVYDEALMKDTPITSNISYGKLLNKNQYDNIEPVGHMNSSIQEKKRESLNEDNGDLSIM